MRTLLVRYAVPALVGLLGMLVALALVHVWSDHAALHQVIAYINQMEAAKGAH